MALLKSVGDFFGVAAGIIGLVGYAPYCRDIIKGGTKPDRVAWLIWTFEYTALFFAQVFEGASHSLWLIGLQLLGVIVVFLLSLRSGFGQFNRQAQLLLLGVLCTLLVWWVTKSGAFAILILLTIEAIGVALTVRKTFIHPESEALSLWVCVGIGGLLGVAAVGVNAALILYAYPVALTFMSTSVITASFLGIRRAKNIPAEGTA